MSDSNGRRSSRLPGFYTRPLEERIAIVAAWAGLSPAEAAVLAGCGLSAGQANLMIENALGAFELPLGVACNFQINSRDYLVPMAIEEPSVLAAVSHAAKLVRSGGGFQTEASEPVMIGQLQLLEVSDMPAAIAAVEAHKAELLAIADEGKRTTLRLGGGARDIEARPFPDTPAGPMLILHLYADVRDAMGANAINTSLERMAPRLAELTGGRVGLRILSNLSDRRTASARCCVPAAALADRPEDGRQVARLIAEANAFALVDPYRAATHNKGIMNGIDAVCVATGNDWRAIEAGAHAYAARHGRYTALTDWGVDEQGDLRGELSLPLAVGIVGGATKVHPKARLALRILGVGSAGELAEVMAAVGLAQNLAAIKALATTGIQAGHMRLHARQVALAAGADEAQVEAIARRLVEEQAIHVGRAQELLSLQADG